jgi:hypothetical protein
VQYFVNQYDCVILAMMATRGDAGLDIIGVSFDAIVFCDKSVSVADVCYSLVLYSPAQQYCLHSQS